MRRTLLRLTFLSITLGASGCGSSDTGSVSGKVYFGDVLVKGGRVTFVFESGRSFPTSIQDDGSYSLDRMPVGKAKICVDTSGLDPKRKNAYSYSPPAGVKKELPDDRTQGPGEYTAIPAKYADHKTTDLAYDLASGSHSYDIKLAK